jgi:hypothetical protein
MKRAAMSLLLACGAVLGTREVAAQARGPTMREARGATQRGSDSPAARARQVAELDAWLRRLHGRFQVRISSSSGGGSTCLKLTGPNGSCLEGPTYFGPPIYSGFDGSADCRGIEAGPGVSCRFEMGPLPDALGAPIVPLEILLGLDPDAPGIRLMWVGGGASVWVASGSLNDNIVKTACVNVSCNGLSSISARRNGERIEMNMETMLPAPREGKMITSPFIATVLEFRRLPDEAHEPPGMAPR